MKRKHAISPGDSEAAKFNAKVLQKLQKALKVDPEADLCSLLPANYSERVDGRRKQALGERASLVTQYR